MKTFTLLLILAIIGHQIYLPKINSILFIDVSILLLWLFWGRQLCKELIHRRKAKNHLRNVDVTHKSKTDSKHWRKQASTQVVINKETYFDKI